MTRLSIVVPCFNEEETCELFYKTVRDACCALGAELEFVFVDDGSTDNTLEILEGLSRRDPERVRYISFSRNFGKEAAIYAGLEYCTGEYVAIMDSDLQDPPELLPELYAEVSSGKCDIARLRRSSRSGEPVLRSFFSKTFYRVINHLSSTEIMDGARDYQLMTRDVADAILSLGEYNRFFKGISSWVGFTTSWHEYENVERAAGESKWSFFSLLRYAISGITAFSVSPLQASSAMGIVFFFASIAFAALIAMRALFFGDPVAGWPSTICIICFIAGLQFLCMGILGNYLAKTLTEVKHRPLYIVKKTNIPKC